MAVDDSAAPTTGQVALKVVRRQVTLIPLIGLIYFSVSGGPYGLENAISSSGPGLAVLMILIVPVIFAVPSALMSAELGASLPLEGGYYYWVKIAMGNFAGFVEGLSSWLVSFLDTALYPVLFVDYLAAWFPALARGQHAVFTAFGGNFSIDLHWLVAIAFMVPLGYLNARGAKVVGDTSVGLMVFILAPFVLLTALGLWKLGTTPHITPLHPFVLPHTGFFTAFGAGLGVVIWNYIGFDAVSTVAGEIDRPQRTYPRALLWSIPMIVVSYLLPLLAALSSGLHTGHVDLWTDGDFANAGGLLGGNWLKGWIIAGALVAQVGLFSSLLMSGSRVPAVLAADRYLPSRLARTSPKYGTPVVAIAVSCVVFAVFCALNFQTLVDSDVMLNMFGMTLEFAALVILRWRYPNMNRPYRIPGGYPALFLVCVFPLALTVWLVWSTFTGEIGAFVIGVGFLAVSALAYWPCRRWLKRDHPDAAVEVGSIDFGPGHDTKAILNRGGVNA
jgi:amino acid transporter